MAAWEPKTFESLAMIARERAVQDGLRGVHEKHVDNRVVYYNDEQKAEKERYEGVVSANYNADPPKPPNKHAHTEDKRPRIRYSSWKRI